jgi:hypothetical protein
MMPQLGHMVFFSLLDNTPAKCAELVAACQKYLTVQPGIVHFSAGVRDLDLTRDVNDTGFDVALHLVFRDRLAHDAYQDDPTHNQFIAEQRHNWRQVRVFDSHIAG